MLTRRSKFISNTANRDAILFYCFSYVIGNWSIALIQIKIIIRSHIYHCFRLSKLNIKCKHSVFARPIDYIDIAARFRANWYTEQITAHPVEMHSKESFEPTVQRYIIKLCIVKL